MNFSQVVFKEFIFQWLCPCKARNRAGDNNRLYENPCYENRRISVVIHIDIGCYSYSYSVV